MSGEETNNLKKVVGNFKLTDHNDIYSFGEPGKDADVWEIRNGYWYKNGVNLGIKAEAVDGTKLESIEALYAVSDTGLTPPEDGWDSVFPEVKHGEYIWSKITWSYDDETSETSYSVSYVGDDAYIIVLSNESHTFKGGTEKALPGETAKVKITVFKDSSEVNATIHDPNVGNTGMEWSKDGNVITFTTIADTELNGVIDIPITVNSIELVRSFSYSISLKGEAGIPAKVITLNASNQIFTEVEGEGTTPSEIEVIGSSQGISIETWEYSINQGAFIETPFPFGITKDPGENIVRVDSSFMSGNIKSVSIRASGGGVSDIFTIYKIVEANIWEIGEDGFWYKNGEVQLDMMALGKDGLDGLDPYQEAQINGFEGTEEEFYVSLGKVKDFEIWLEKDGVKLIERIGTTVGLDGELQGIVGTKITDIEAGKIILSEDTEGEIAGMTIDTTSLTFSRIGSYFRITSDGVSDFIRAGTSSSSPSFRVDSNGKLYATGGEIAGMTIDTTSLTFSRIGSYFRITSDGVSDFIRAGTSSSSPSFRVDSNGKLYATGAVINGDVTAIRLTNSMETGYANIGAGPQGGSGIEYVYGGDETKRFIWSFLTDFGLALYLHHKQRLYIGQNGAFVVYDHLGSSRLYIDEHGHFSIYDHLDRNRVYIANDGGTFINDAQGVHRLYIENTNNNTLLQNKTNTHAIGVNNTGPYYIKNNVRTYFTSLPESGSNENGNWVRFLDGTLICWHSRSMSCAAGLSTAATWTYPKKFTGTSPSVNITSYTGSTQAQLYGMTLISSTTVSSVSYHQRNQGTNTITIGQHLIAIGKG